MIKTNREAKRISESYSDFLQLLIVDFLHFVKRQDENDEQAHIKVDAKYKELNQRWKNKCHGAGKEFMQKHVNLFAEELQKLAKPKDEPKIIQL